MGRRVVFENVMARIVEVIILFCAAFSLTFCISTYFNLEVSVRDAVIFFVLTSLWLLFVSTRKKSVWVLEAVGLIIWGIHTYLNWQVIKEEKILLPLMFLAVLIMALSIYRYRSSMVLIVITTILLVLFLVTDKYPRHDVFFMWLASVVACRCIRKSGGNRIALFMFAGSFIIMSMLHINFGVSMSEVIREHSSDIRYFQQRINTSLTSLLNRIDGTTRLNGRLDNADPGNNTKTDIIITLEEAPVDNIYLRGFVGVDYNGNAWMEISDDIFENEVSSWNIGGKNYKTIQSQIFSAYYLKYGSSLSRMKIKVADYNEPYALIPYGRVMDSQNFFMGDGEVLRIGKDEISYTYVPQMSSEIATGMEMPFGMLSISAELIGTTADTYGYDEVMLNYTRYVYKTYLRTPANLVNLQGVCRQMNRSTFLGAKTDIRKYLTSTCTYSLVLDPVPYESDFTEFFLFSQRKGYCTHFATAATLMFRMLGYPSRFVSGYAVKPSDFVKTQEGLYVAEVTGNEAHAWTEVYLGGVWYPVEMTPGYVSTAPDYNLTEDFRQKDDIIKETQKAPIEEKYEMSEDVTDSHVEEVKDIQEDSKSNVMTGVLWCLVSCAIISAAILLRRIIVLNVRWFFVKKNKKRKIIRYLTVYTMKMLEHGGYLQKELSDTEYAATIPVEGFAEFIRIAQKERFSKNRISGEEVQYCLDMSKSIECMLYENLTDEKKMLWKYIYCYR